MLMSLSLQVKKFRDSDWCFYIGLVLILTAVVLYGFVNALANNFYWAVFGGLSIIGLICLGSLFVLKWSPDE